MSKSTLRLLIKQRDAANSKIDQYQKKLNAINELIISTMDEMNIDVFETKTAKISVGQNTYTKYNWDKLMPIFKDKLKKAEITKLVTRTVSYKMDNTVLLKLLSSNRLRSTDMKNGTSTSTSKKFVRVNVVKS